MKMPKMVVYRRELSTVPIKNDVPPMSIDYGDRTVFGKKIPIQIKQRKMWGVFN